MRSTGCAMRNPDRLPAPCAVYPAPCAILLQFFLASAPCAIVNRLESQLLTSGLTF
ncbi:hypothetical protein L195_g052057 [Trifolium pratense]|uniref:Uncharacterized protein n=1 Tax=Trifolium pratense TaxID=57577 RepID=A0A2K3K303_TRIPR|nr:hypothetical protein L195_g052057 [Trifolium pratense]